MSNETPTVSSPSATQTYTFTIVVGKEVTEILFTDEIVASSEEEASIKICEKIQNMDVVDLYMSGDPAFSAGDTYLEERDCSEINPEHLEAL